MGHHDQISQSLAPSKRQTNDKTKQESQQKKSQPYHASIVVTIKPEPFRPMHHDTTISNCMHGPVAIKLGLYAGNNGHDE